MRRPASSFGPPGRSALEARRGDGEVPPRRRRVYLDPDAAPVPEAPAAGTPAAEATSPEAPPEFAAPEAPPELATPEAEPISPEPGAAVEVGAAPGSEGEATPPAAAAEAEGWEPIVSTSWPPPPAEATASDGTPAPFVPAKVEGPVAAQVIDAVKIYGYGDTAVYALAGITAAFGKGRFTAIMGPSGSGKSTLMHCLAGLDRLTQGKVVIGDIDLSSLNDKALTKLRRDKVGFIFQMYNLVPTLTALENITLPLDLAGSRPDKAWLGNVVDTLRIRDRLKHKPDELSGGQQQRVAVARALATKPAIIFADEPTGNLDTRAGAEVLHIMQDSVRDLGQTVVMVTHDPVAAGYADRAIFLVDGRVVAEMFDPTAERVLDEMKHLGD